MKNIVISVLCILVGLGLSGFMNDVREFEQFEDGSGRLVRNSEFKQEWVDYDPSISNMEEFRDQLFLTLEEAVFYSEDHPNIAAVSTDSYIDPVTGSLHFNREVDVVDMLAFESPYETKEEEEFFFTANSDGTYRFSHSFYRVWDDPASVRQEFEDGQYQEAPSLWDAARITIILHVGDFIEGDPSAVYNPAEKTVTWNLPYVDFLFLENDLEFWAVYRIDAPEEVEVLPDIDASEPDVQEEPIPPSGVVGTDQDGGFLGLPDWAPLVLVGLCCLTLVGVGVVILVFVVLKKRKQDK